MVLQHREHEPGPPAQRRVGRPEHAHDVVRPRRVAARVGVRVARRRARVVERGRLLSARAEPRRDARRPAAELRRASRPGRPTDDELLFGA